MRSGLIWLASVAAGALVWVASPELPSAARLFVALMLGPLPAASILQARSFYTLPRPLPRVHVYFGSMVLLWALGATAVAIGIESGFSLRSMGFRAVDTTTFALWTAVATGVGAAVVVMFKAGGMRETEIMHELMPVTRTEKTLFVGLSISAGVCEEAAFRAFLMLALTYAAESLPAAAVISSLAFGIVHAHQQTAGAMRAAVLGLLLAVPVIVTGSVYPSMAAHALIDIGGGLWFARWLVK